MSLFHKDCPIISVMSLFIIHSKLGYYNIVNNTNNYATETIPDFADMSKNWLHTNAGEIMAFLGVVIFMGIVFKATQNFHVLLHRPKNLPGCSGVLKKPVLSTSEIFACVCSN